MDIRRTNDGWIEVICGSMFAGKTEELIRRINRIKYAKKDIIVFKPKIDDRYELKPNVHIGSFKIDMAIYDKTENTYKLGIQCTGNEYHKHSNEVTNDIYKQRYLDVRKWKMLWIFESDYLYDKEKELVKLDDYLKDFYKK